MTKPNRKDELGDAIALWPIRVNQPKVKARAILDNETINGYDPKEKMATVPVGDNAYERTVRLHEALHAIYSGPVNNTVVEQTCEDLRLHLNHAKLEGQPRRDEITAAVRDLRSIAQLTSKSWRMKDIDDELLGVFLRSVAILQGHSGWTPSSKAARYSSLIKAAYQNLQCQHKAKLGKSLKKAFDSIRLKDDIKGAVGALKGHFMEPFGSPKAGGGSQQQWSLGDAPQKGQGITNPLIKMTAPTGDHWMPGWGDGEFAEIKLPPDVEGVMPEEPVKRLADLHRKNLIPKVRVHRLSMTHPKRQDEGPKTISAYSGSKIRAKRLAAAMTSPVPIRLFKRKRVNVRGGVGGTILIDASGSMAIKDDQLDELMELCPLGSIAYYDGRAEGSDQESANKGGDIVIVAERGMQADLSKIREGTNGRPKRNGYNLIDLQAMQWMMTQPRPWWFLTDGGFTGACAGFATDLLHSLMKRGLVKVVRSAGSMKNILKEATAGAGMKAPTVDEE